MPIATPGIEMPAAPAERAEEEFADDLWFLCLGGDTGKSEATIDTPVSYLR